MDLRLKGKSVIVTGGGRGIGLAIVSTFAEEGANVAIAQRTLELAQKAAEGMKKLGVDSLAIQADITNRQSVEDMVKAATDKFGKVDILVNNSTVLAGAGPWMDEKWEDVAKEVDTVYWGYSYCMRAVLPQMIEQKSGVIINMLSDSARVGDAMMGNYAGVKAGVGGLSRTLAREMGRYGIRINCVSPSMTMTELAKGRREIERDKLGDEKYQDLMKRRLRLYPLGRLGEPEDVANTVVFLASDRAGWITGQTVSINGGYAIGPW